jgi:hypothetical protein
MTRPRLVHPIVALPHGRGKGNSQALLPVNPSSSPPLDNGRQNENLELLLDKGSEGTLSADRSHQGRQTRQPVSHWETSDTGNEIARRKARVLENASSPGQNNGHRPVVPGEYEEYDV